MRGEEGRGELGGRDADALAAAFAHDRIRGTTTERNADGRGARVARSVFEHAKAGGGGVRAVSSASKTRSDAFVLPATVRDFKMESNPVTAAIGGGSLSCRQA